MKRKRQLGEGGEGEGKRDSVGGKKERKWQ